MLTRTADWKIPCVYIDFYQITKIEDLVKEDIFQVSF